MKNKHNKILGKLKNHFKVQVKLIVEIQNKKLMKILKINRSMIPNKNSKNDKKQYSNT